MANSTNKNVRGLDVKRTNNSMQCDKERAIHTHTLIHQYIYEGADTLHTKQSRGRGNGQEKSNLFINVG